MSLQIVHTFQEIISMAVLSTELKTYIDTFIVWETIFHFFVAMYLSSLLIFKK